MTRDTPTHLGGAPHRRARPRLSDLQILCCTTVDPLPYLQTRAFGEATDRLVAPRASRPVCPWKPDQYRPPVVNEVDTCWYFVGARHSVEDHLVRAARLSWSAEPKFRPIGVGHHDLISTLRNPRTHPKSRSSRNSRHGPQFGVDYRAWPLRPAAEKSPTPKAGYCEQTKDRRREVDRHDSRYRAPQDYFDDERRDQKEPADRHHR
jgi:hypothetical protein